MAFKARHTASRSVSKVVVMPQGGLVPACLLGAQAIDPRKGVLGRNDARPLQRLGIAAGLAFFQAYAVVTGRPARPGQCGSTLRERRYDWAPGSDSENAPVLIGSSPAPTG